VAGDDDGEQVVDEPGDGLGEDVLGRGLRRGRTPRGRPVSAFSACGVEVGLLGDEDGDLGVRVYRRPTSRRTSRLTRCASSNSSAASRMSMSAVIALDGWSGGIAAAGSMTTTMRFCIRRSTGWDPVVLVQVERFGVEVPQHSGRKMPSSAPANLMMRCLVSPTAVRRASPPAKQDLDEGVLIGLCSPGIRPRNTWGVGLAYGGADGGFLFDDWCGPRGGSHRSGWVAVLYAGGGHGVVGVERVDAGQHASVAVDESLGQGVEGVAVKPCSQIRARSAR